MNPLPLLPVTTVGSWPRPPELLRAQRLKQTGRLSAEAFERQADVAVLGVLRLQEKAGVDIVTDGEQRRDNFYSFVAEKLAGTQLMTLLEMLDIVEDKASFERVLQTLDVPAYSMRNPTCIGRIERRQSLAVDELRFLKRHTDKPVKIPLSGSNRRRPSEHLSSRPYSSIQRTGCFSTRIVASARSRTGQ